MRLRMTSAQVLSASRNLIEAKTEIFLNDPTLEGMLELMGDLREHLAISLSSKEEKELRLAKRSFAKESC